MQVHQCFSKDYEPSWLQKFAYLCTGKGVLRSNCQYTTWCNLQAFCSAGKHDPMVISCLLWCHSLAIRDFPIKEWWPTEGLIPWFLVPLPVNKIWMPIGSCSWPAGGQQQVGGQSVLGYRTWGPHVNKKRAWVNTQSPNYWIAELISWDWPFVCYFVKLFHDFESKTKVN